MFGSAPRFKGENPYYKQTKYYIAEIRTSGSKKWKDICVSCRRKTKYYLWVHVFLLKGVYSPIKIITCCGPECAEKEINLLDLEMVEAITC